MGRWSRGTNVEMVWCHQMIRWFHRTRWCHPSAICVQPPFTFLEISTRAARILEVISTYFNQLSWLRQHLEPTDPPREHLTALKSMLHSKAQLNAVRTRPTDGLTGWNFGFLNSTWVICVSPCITEYHHVGYLKTVIHADSTKLMQWTEYHHVTLALALLELSKITFQGLVVGPKSIVTSMMITSGSVNSFGCDMDVCICIYVYLLSIFRNPQKEAEQVHSMYIRFYFPVFLWLPIYVFLILLLHANDCSTIKSLASGCPVPSVLISINSSVGATGTSWRTAPARCNFKRHRTSPRGKPGDDAGCFSHKEASGNLRVR